MTNLFLQSIYANNFCLFNFEFENEVLVRGYYVYLVLYVKAIKMSFPTKHLNKLKILLYKKETGKIFLLKRKIYAITSTRNWKLNA